MRFDDNIREHDLQAKIGDTPAKFVVVGEKVDEGFESADALQIVAPKS